MCIRDSNWWDYCGSILVNSYPTYFEKLPPLIERERYSKYSSHQTRLCVATLGNDAGIIGAAFLGER